MTEVVLNRDQARLVSIAKGEILVRDPEGLLLGRLVPSVFSREEIDEAKKRGKSAGPWKTTAEVLERLDSMAQQ